MKLGKATIYFYSLESYEEPKEVLQETLNYKDWVSYDLFNYKSVDIGDWHDEIDLNNSTLTKIENTYSKYFQNVGMDGTTTIKIDYYEELKAYSDKWIEKETPYKPTTLKSNEFGDILGKCKCGATVLIDENYCNKCSQRLDWTEDV